MSQNSSSERVATDLAEQARADFVRGLLLEWDPAHLTGLVPDEPTYEELVRPVLHAMSLAPSSTQLARTLRQLCATSYRFVVPADECSAAASRLWDAR